jgi:hypothetical protein
MMAGSMVEEISRSFALNIRYAQNLLQDVSNDQMTSQPVAGMNHPAWIVGHLTHSFQAIGGEMGIAAWLPEGWAERFGTGSALADDPSQYPPQAELIEVFNDAAERVSNRLKQLSDLSLSEPLPDERYRHVFPTLGSAALHILTCHLSVHLGQLSAWRRAMRMKPVEDPL